MKEFMRGFLEIFEIFNTIRLENIQIAQINEVFLPNI